MNLRKVAGLNQLNRKIAPIFNDLFFFSPFLLLFYNSSIQFSSEAMKLYQAIVFQSPDDSVLPFCNSSEYLLTFYLFLAFLIFSIKHCIIVIL